MTTRIYIEATGAGLSETGLFAVFGSRTVRLPVPPGVTWVPGPLGAVALLGGMRSIVFSAGRGDGVAYAVFEPSPGAPRGGSPASSGELDPVGTVGLMTELIGRVLGGWRP